MTLRELKLQLSAPFPARDVDWRVTKVSGESGLAVPYLRSRAIQNRLDEVVGPFCWRTRYIPWHNYTPKARKNDTGDLQPISSQLCALSIYCEARGEWIEKQDGAENTEYESIKGGISDSFKRAAVLWSIGRYLYAVAPKWAAVDACKQLTANGLAALRQHYDQQLQALGLSVAPTAVAAASVYQVVNVQPVAMPDGSAACWLALRLPDQRQMTVFRRGQDLVSGLAIQNATLVQQQGASGAYYELTAYDLADQDGKAV